MPYIIKSSKDGFKVCKKSKPDDCFSKEPLPLERAKKQRVAIIISENKDDYLNKAKQFAKKAGYEDWDQLKLAEKPYKLELNGVKFGREPYTDYVQNLLNNSPDAEQKRKSYLARATKIKGDWKSNKYSPNNLAIKILWGGGEDTESSDGQDTESSDGQDTEGGAKPFFGRMGGKSRLANRLIPMFPTEGVETFVEPFVGAGNIFWRLDHKPEIKYVINDFDSGVVKIFKSLKQGDKCLEDAGAFISREEFKRLKNKTGRTGCDELALLRNSFFSMGTSYNKINISRSYAPFPKKRLEEAEDILKNTTILNQSFEKVIEKYDDKTTFFYLDPPYENPNQSDYKDYVTPEQVYDAVRNMKGRFLLSYNNSSNIRNIFKDFNIKTIKTKYAHTQNFEQREKTELIITNYMPGHQLKGGDLTQEITNAFLYGIAYSIFNPGKTNTFNFQPNALLPGPKDMLDMTIQSYKDPAQSIGKYELVLDKPTYKFYANASVLIIAVRGTQEIRDVRAWLPIARGDVIETDRVSTDLRDIQTSLSEYKDYTVFGTGHSLAGVILDKLLDRKLILQAVSFNPAVEKVDLLNSDNLRYYLEQDPLFNIMGHFANNTIVLDRPQNLWVRLLKIITPSTASINPASDHFIDKFKPHIPDNYGLVGGAIPTNKELYEKAKEIVYPLYDKPSAFRSGAVVKKYKELGGEFKDDGERPLERWFQEEWKDIGSKEYPVFRPTKRVSKDTPLTPDEIDHDNLKEQIELKQQIKGEQNLPAFKAKGGAMSLEADIAAHQSAGGEKVDETIKDKLEEIVTEPMDGGDIAHYYPKVRIIKYNDLDNYTSIEELLPSDDTYFILLYLDSPSTGHWVAMTRNNNLITFFDSYGGKIDSQLKWVDMGERIRLDTDKPCLTRLLKAGNVPYNYSPYDYQSNNPSVASCGAHCLNFITCTLDKGMSVNDYKLHMDRIRERTGLDFDEIVAMNFPVR